jgi:hypothetical protein
MIVIFGLIALAIAAGYVLGGSIDNLMLGGIRWGALAVIGLAMQWAPVPMAGIDLPLILLYVSFGLLLAFTLKNLRVPGMALVLIGLVLNVTVIAVNHGMPVPRHALVASHQQDTLQYLVREGGAKHHLAGPGDVLMPLADVIAVGPPVRQAYSVGDVLSYLGVFWLIAGGVRRGLRVEPRRRRSRFRSFGRRVGLPMSRVEERS